MTTAAPQSNAGSEAERDGENVPVELRLDLPSFEGPMDLLLELVRSHEIDIFDIPIALVTEEYLACIERMEELDLEVGADWLEMAARLMYIKSRTLLPDDDEEDEEEGPDPREELVRRLIEYERFKRCAEMLGDRPSLGSEVFESNSEMEQFRRETGPPDVRNADVSALMDAVQRMIDSSAGEAEEFVYEMTREQLSLRSVILDIAERLEHTPRVTFESLFDGEAASRNRVVTAFVGLLEMSRLGMIELFQSRLGDVETLYIERSVVDILEVSQTLDLPEETGEEAPTAAVAEST